MSDAAAVNRPPRPTRTGVGITGRGIVVLIFVVTAVVGAAAVLAGGHRGHAFGIAFIVTAALGAALVRRKDITTAMIAPPLLYCVLVVLMSFIDTKDQTGGLLTSKAVYIADAFITGAPAIWSGTALAVAIGWYRRRSAAARTGSPAASATVPPTVSPAVPAPASSMTVSPPTVSPPTATPAVASTASPSAVPPDTTDTSDPSDTGEAD